MNPNSTTASLTILPLSRHHPTEIILARPGTEKKVCLRKHWRASEDAKLKQLVAQNGPQNWKSFSEQVPGRSGKSCRLRWCNQLDPTINKQPFTEEEEFRLLHAQRFHGNKWATIARYFHGRTDNAIKNQWYIIRSRRAKERRQERRQKMVSARYSHGGSAFSTCTTELSVTPPSATVPVAQPLFLTFSNTLAPGYNGEYVQRAEVNGLNGQEIEYQNHHKVAVSEGKVEMKKLKNGVYFYDFLGVEDA